MAVVASDSFTRANETPLASPWVNLVIDTVSLRLASNHVDSPNYNRDALAYYSATWPNDQYAQAKITVSGSAGGGQGAGVAVRIDGTGANYYRAVIDHAASNNVEVARVVSSSYTALGQRTTAFTDGDTLRLEVSGTTLTVKLNGSQLGATFSDSNISSGSAGIFFSSVETSATWDDFEGGDVGGAATPSHSFMTLLGVT